MNVDLEKIFSSRPGFPRGLRVLLIDEESTKQSQHLHQQLEELAYEGEQGARTGWVRQQGPSLVALGAAAGCGHSSLLNGMLQSRGWARSVICSAGRASCEQLQSPGSTANWLPMVTAPRDILPLVPAVTCCSTGSEAATLLRREGSGFDIVLVEVRLRRFWPNRLAGLSIQHLPQASDGGPSGGHWRIPGHCRVLSGHLGALSQGI